MRLSRESSQIRLVSSAPQRKWASVGFDLYSPPAHHHNFLLAKNGALPPHPHSGAVREIVLCFKTKSILLSQCGWVWGRSLAKPPSQRPSGTRRTVPPKGDGLYCFPVPGYSSARRIRRVSPKSLPSETLRICSAAQCPPDPVGPSRGPGKHYFARFWSRQVSGLLQVWPPRCSNS